MRLIDADRCKYGRIIEAILSEHNFPIIKEMNVSDIPTAYDLDKVVEQLEEVEKIMTSPVNKDCFGEECRASDCTVCLISKAIEIVKGGGVK